MADKIITDSEMKTFYLWSIWAKPVLIYALVGVIVTVAFTGCYMLIADKSTMDNTSALLMAIVGATAPILGVIFAGKSYERGRGVREDEYIPNRATSPEESFANRALTAPTISALGDLEDDPLQALNSVDMSELEDYIPKIADDKPQV